MQTTRASTHYSMAGQERSNWPQGLYATSDDTVQQLDHPMYSAIGSLTGADRDSKVAEAVTDAILTLPPPGPVLLHGNLQVARLGHSGR